MEIRIGQVFEDQKNGVFLKVKKIGLGDIKIHSLWIVDEKGEIIPVPKNKYVNQSLGDTMICSEKTLKTFKQII